MTKRPSDYTVNGRRVRDYTGGICKWAIDAMRAERALGATYGEISLRYDISGPRAWAITRDVPVDPQYVRPRPGTPRFNKRKGHPHEINPLMAEGLSRREIARRLGICETTVRRALKRNATEG